MEAVEKISRGYGEEHVHLKAYGFKPDFWVSLADALTVEAVILDQANHQVCISTRRIPRLETMTQLSCPGK
jgi:hypothetical protein